MKSSQMYSARPSYHLGAMPRCFYAIHSCRTSVCDICGNHQDKANEAALIRFVCNWRENVACRQRRVQRIRNKMRWQQTLLEAKQKSADVPVAVQRVAASVPAAVAGDGAAELCFGGEWMMLRQRHMEEGTAAPQGAFRLWFVGEGSENSVRCNAAAAY